MEAVELTVYVALAVLVGGMLIAFLQDWDATGAFERLRQLYFEEDDGFKEVSADALPGVAHGMWSECAYGERNGSRTVYAQGTGNFTEQDLFEGLKKVNLCDTLQSAEHSCGDGDDVVFNTSVQLPSVVRFSCDPVRRMLVIT